MYFSVNIAIKRKGMSTETNILYVYLPKYLQNITLPVNAQTMNTNIRYVYCIFSLFV